MCSQGVGNQQTGGDSHVDTIFAGLQKQSRLTVRNELGRFIGVDTNEGMKIGDLEKNSEAINVMRARGFREMEPIMSGGRRVAVGRQLPLLG